MNIERRIGALEQRAVNGRTELGVLLIPRGLTPDEQQAWIAALGRHTDTGPGVIIIPHKDAQ